MNILIIGCGKVGSKFAEVLSSEGHDVVIIDSDRNSFRTLSPEFNGVKIVGVPIDQDVLKQAGIENADAFAAVTPDDNINIMASQVAKEIFKVPKVIARIYNPEREHVFHQFGLDTICPTNITVDVIHSMVAGAGGLTNHTIGGSNIVFRYEKAPKGLEGRPVTEVKVPKGAHLFGLMRNGQVIFNAPEVLISKDDTIVIAEKPE